MRALPATVEVRRPSLCYHSAVEAAGQMPRDREVLALALPALGALIAEPLYVLGDTAIVGHLGTVSLAGLAVAGLLLSELLGFTTFLEYGTTSRAARLYGSGDLPAALDVGVQATWLALAMGLVMVVSIELLAAPAVHLVAGGSTPAAAEGLSWLRIAALGSPFVLVTAAAQGWLRGFQDTRTPLYVLALANVGSICLSLLFIRGLGFGIEGSAIANVIAQTACGLFFSACWCGAARARRWRPAGRGSGHSSVRPATCRFGRSRSSPPSPSPPASRPGWATRSWPPTRSAPRSGCSAHCSWIRPQSPPRR